MEKMAHRRETCHGDRSIAASAFTLTQPDISSLSVHYRNKLNGYTDGLIYADGLVGDMPTAGPKP